MTDLPDYYFRIRENGAAVFRVDGQNRDQRLEMTQIAMINIRSGAIRPQGAHVLSPRDEARIAQWMEARQAVLARREEDDMRRLVEELNLAAHWVQTRASDAALDEVTEELLLAMHDLRGVLVRRKASRLPPQKRTPE